MQYFIAYSFNHSTYYIGDCRVPIIGGRDLDLHKLFVEVTSRGGINKVCECPLRLSMIN